jgi:integrase/recombinase XerD
MSDETISPLRRRMIEDMTVRGIGAKTRLDYVRHVRTFAAFIGRSPDTTTAEEVRRFQLHQTATGVGAPSINSAVSALRFLLEQFLQTPDGRAAVWAVPFKRFAELNELDGPLLLLASNASSYMTGAVLTADGALSCNLQQDPAG